MILQVPIYLGLILATTISQSAIAADPKNRHNLFDPIYAYDDIDAHTVSASLPAVSSNQNVASTSSRLPSTTTPRQQPLKPPALLNRDDGFDDKPLRRVPLVKIQSLDGTNSQSRASSTRSLITSTVQTSPTTHGQEPRESFKFKRQEQEPARHWSALDNYYQKLRQLSASNGNGQQQQQQNQEQQSQVYQPLYQIIQQQSQQDPNDLLNAYRPLSSNSPYTLTSNGNGVIYTNVNSNSNSKNPTAFMLPIITSNPSSGNSNPSQSVILPSIEPDFGRTVYGQMAPGISRTGGIGSGGILVNPNQEQKLIWVQPQEGVKSTSVSATPNWQVSNYNNFNTQQRESVPFGSSTADGRVKYLEWRKLPELLLIQQQQQRVKHQQETFGAWYDLQRSRELLQEEAFCGPRNYVNFQVVKTPNQSLVSYSGLKFQLDSSVPINSVSNQLDVPVTLSAGEYPSHMGIYNNSSPSDDNFLCSATYVHEQFALTLASCLKSIVDYKKIVVRANEWNLNKNSTSSNNVTVTRDIEQVHFFPKYRPDSLEHNLALIKFTKPIDYLEHPYICPACQIQTRSSLKTSSCWAPVRNTTITEYFDAEGEGELKDKKSVSMIELPIKLIANDDNECFKQTKIEFFNFQHPNYICSANFRTSQWRARLNQTDYFGSGIYCNEAGNLNLVSILHPIQSNSSSAYGYLDLSYYKPWMRNVINGRSF